MRFMMMYIPQHNTEACLPPSEEKMAAMAKLIDESTSSGELLMTGGLLPMSKGARVRLAAGELAVIDGPFTEAKEVIGGFAIIQAESKDKAIESAKRFLKVAGDGECEVRPMMESSERSQHA